jgi:hypothetical protein
MKRIRESASRIIPPVFVELVPIDAQTVRLEHYGANGGRPEAVLSRWCASREHGVLEERHTRTSQTHELLKE